MLPQNLRHYYVVVFLRYTYIPLTISKIQFGYSECFILKRKQTGKIKLSFANRHFHEIHCLSGIISAIKSIISERKWWFRLQIIIPKDVLINEIFARCIFHFAKIIFQVKLRKIGDRLGQNVCQICIISTH